MKKSKLNTEDGSEFTVYYLNEQKDSHDLPPACNSLMDEWNSGMNIGTLESFLKGISKAKVVSQPSSMFGGLELGDTELRVGSIYFVRGLNVTARFKDYQGHQGDLRCEFVTSGNVEFSVKKDLVAFATDEQVEDFLNDCTN